MGGQSKVVNRGRKTAPPASLRAYARHRGVALSAVQKAIEAGRLSACLVKKRGSPTKIASLEAADREWDANTNPVKALPSALAKVVSQSPPPPPSGPGPEAPDVDQKPPTLNEAMAREKEWKAKLAELDYRERMGQLVSAREVESKMVETFTRCRTKMLGLPSKLKTAIPNLTRAELVTVDRLVREALEDLALVESTEGAA